MTTPGQDLLEEEDLEGDVLELLRPFGENAERLPRAAHAAALPGGEERRVLGAVERFRLYFKQSDCISVLLEDVDAGLLPADEQRRLEERDLVATELVESALIVVGNAAAVLELHAIDVFRLGEGLDHVAALGQQGEVGVHVPVVGVAVFAEEELGVAAAGELEVRFGEGTGGHSWSYPSPPMGVKQRIEAAAWGLLGASPTNWLIVRVSSLSMAD
jgi:hypothetical protein